ncbi:MAG: MBOAT family protein [Flavobacteriia bacterium]|nr:MBOAT family protein [Flavobacteriia bacterium]
MLFTSLDFFLFLPIVLIGYYLISPKYRWIFLLVASYFFYAGWKINYLGLIIFSTVVDFIASNLIFKTENKSKRRWLLGASLFINFTLLIVFKYFHFLIGGSHWFKNLANTNDDAMWLQFVFEYGIPVGISFYTFQSVSYVVDVYRKRTIPEKSFGKFALYVTFFPQLVAGPIERFEHLHPQLFKKFTPNWQHFRTGLQIMLVGFFLKMSVADNIGAFVSPIFNSPELYSLSTKWLGVLLFGIQIYTDFNGYTLIAIGCAHFFGVQLMDNFRLPYGSYSLKDFWSRWHISLSTWFRDYVYIPLGGSKSKKYRWFMAIFITFFLSGLWHGAAVNFIYWGILHGLYYLIEQAFFPIKKDRILPYWEKSIRWILTMSVVAFGWLLFRIDRMKKVKLFFQESEFLKTEISMDYLLIIPLFFFLIYELIVRKKRPNNFLDTQSTTIRWGIYLILIALIVMFANTGDLAFIYFQF